MIMDKGAEELLPENVGNFHDESSSAWTRASTAACQIACTEKDLSMHKDLKSPSKKRKSAIKKLISSVPAVSQHFNIVRQIGSGTFSKVYLATLKCLGDASPLYALKQIFSTSHPKRIENEVKYLKEIGGKNHVVGVDSCIRHKGDFIIIMPYIAHSKFSNVSPGVEDQSLNVKYQEVSFNMHRDKELQFVDKSYSESIQDLLNLSTMEDVREYMRQLLMSLEQVHGRNVIHRDVKPNNFLFDLDSKKGALVDFGLAQEVAKPRPSKTSLRDRSGLPCPPDITLLFKEKPALKELRKIKLATSLLPPHPEAPVAKRRCLAEIQNKMVPSKTINQDLAQKLNDRKSQLSLSAKKRKMRPRHTPPGESAICRKTLTSCQQQQRLTFSTFTSTSLPVRSTPSVKKNSKVTIADVFPSIRKYGNRSVRKPNAQRPGSRQSPSCNCYGQLTVCRKCLARVNFTAPRAGTAGFRSPEVLFRHEAQTTAVDIWAAGVIFLSLLSGRCPFFQPADDMESLAQIVLLFGSKKVQEVAQLFDRKLTCSTSFPGHSMRGVVTKLKDAFQDGFGPTLRRPPRKSCQSDGESPGGADKDTRSKMVFTSADIPDSAFELLKELLDLNPDTRITASRALRHDFFRV